MRLATVVMLALVIVIAAASTGAAPGLASLSESRRLAAVYDLILAAQFGDAELRLRDTCPPAEVPSCKALHAVSLWWQILIDPESRLLDRPLNEAATEAIAASDAWTRREPQRAEAWFYLAGSYAPLVQWRVLRGERLAAAREGSRIKAALERALELDPSLWDAYFGIGLYHYYADVAPAYAKVLRLLLRLPGGDRGLGLREMLQARDRGQIVRGEADYQLHLIDLWYEHKPRAALELLESLDARYPSNPLFLERIADVHDTYLHDHRASAAAWRTLLDRAQAGRVHEPAVAETRGRLGLAAALIDLNEVDLAIAQLQIVIDANPFAPIGARARAAALMREARARKNF